MPWFRALERINLKSRVLTTVARVTQFTISYLDQAYPIRTDVRSCSAQTKVSADQFIAAPCLVGLFFTAMPILEGKPHEIRERLSTKWQPTIVKNWMVFIPTQAIKSVHSLLAESCNNRWHGWLI